MRPAYTLSMLGPYSLQYPNKGAIHSTTCCPTEHDVSVFSIVLNSVLNLLGRLRLSRRYHTWFFKIFCSDTLLKVNKKKFIFKLIGNGLTELFWSSVDMQDSDTYIDNSNLIIVILKLHNTKRCIWRKTSTSSRLKIRWKSSRNLEIIIFNFELSIWFIKNIAIRKKKCWHRLFFVSKKMLGPA